jgi:ABC-type transporter Mla MlaB component
MINMRRKGNVLAMRLSEESTIACVEADTRLLGEKLRSLENLREMDTAYFQLLVSLSLTAKRKGIEFLISRPSEKFRELAALYGLNEKDLSGRDTCPEPL